MTLSTGLGQVYGSTKIKQILGHIMQSMQMKNEKNVNSSITISTGSKGSSAQIAPVFNPKTYQIWRKCKSHARPMKFTRLCKAADACRHQYPNFQGAWKRYMSCLKRHKRKRGVDTRQQSKFLSYVIIDEAMFMGMFYLKAMTHNST